MVRELLQPLNGGESDPTELGNRNLAPILESHGWALKSPWNRPFYPPLYCAGSWGERGGEWVTVGWVTGLSFYYRQKPVPPVLENRCHRVLLNPWTFVHIFKFALPFSFLFLSLPFNIHFCTTICLRYGFLRDFDEMWEIQSLQSLEIRMSSFF
jgi:hypothetical protein